MKILNMLVIGLFLVSMVPVAVFAEEPETVGDLVTARQDFREKTNQLKDTYRAHKAEFSDKRLELRDRRTQYQACKADKGEESTDCQTLKDSLRSTSKDFMLSGIELVQPWLESGITNLDGLSWKDERSAQIDEALTYLNEDLAEINAIKAKVEALPSVPSDEEIKSVGQELSLAIRKARLDLKYGAGIIVRYRFDSLFQRLGGTNEGTYGALDATFAELEAQGKDVSAIGSDIADMKAEVELAEQAYNAAIVKYDQARDMSRPATEKDDMKAAFDVAKEGFDEYKTAKEHLNTARGHLRSAVQAIKAIEGGQAILEANVVKYLL